MKLSVDISELAVEELSYPAFEALSSLLRMLNEGREHRITLQDPDAISKIKKELLMNKSRVIMDSYIKLLQVIKSDLGMQRSHEESDGQAFESRKKYKSIDPGSFNNSYKEELATGEYRRSKKGNFA